jgi:filamentous hemagglutinin
MMDYTVLFKKVSVYYGLAQSDPIDFTGTHDTLNSFIWYDELGNGEKLDSTLLGKVGDITNNTNVIIATPFALSVLLPPDVWNSVFTLMKSKN